MDRIPVTAGLTYVSAAVSFLELRVGILSGAWMSLSSVVCCQVEVSASSRSLAQRIRSDYGVCGLETATTRTTRPTRAIEPR